MTQRSLPVSCVNLFPTLPLLRLIPMKILFALVSLVALHLCTLPVPAQKKPTFPELKQLQGPQNPRLGFIIHGGAGTITRASMTPETEKAFRAKLEEAVMAGYKAL